MNGRKRQHQHREIVQVRQNQEQIETGEQHRHPGPEKEPVDLWRRVVHRGEEAARYRRQNHRTAAVGQPSRIHSTEATMIARTVEATEYSIIPRSRNGVSRPRRQCR
jgi:hypothetical protein